MKHISHHGAHLTIYAIVLLAIGLLLRYQICRRRFNRRGITGLQHFRTYSQALFITVMEKVFSLIGALLIIGAIILYLIK